MATKTTQPPPSPEDKLTTLRAARDAAQRDRDNAANARASAASARAAIKPADFPTPASHREAVARADRAIADAAADEAFYSDRLAGAEAELRRGEIEDLHDGLKSAILARQLALPVLREGVTALVAQLAAPGAVVDSIALVRETEASINELVAALRQAEPEQPVPPVPYDELSARLPSFVDRTPGAGGILRTAANIAVWIDAAPQRERAAREDAEAREREARNQYHQECLRGAHGAEERRRAQEEQREWGRTFYGVGYVAPSLSPLAIGTYVSEG